ncbi:A/G-specific adenine glycosylase [Janibacter alittae]|uniref:Adenine DNA glycosylase n=1 Tax=Janibacter alittae TaxID=3115209 RepID=A0ABZ2MFJ6_9MICO
MTDAAGPLLHHAVASWYADHGRDLPWREPDCSAWGVYLSEVMSQQTPIARVLPIWERWMERWPTPFDLASDAPGEAVRMWDRLGYPRRALRLWESATVMVEQHDGQVPREHADLLALPGVGAYTAAAVASFAFGDPRTVVDTNVRRVLARTVTGQQHAAASLTVAETRLAERSMPRTTDEANTWNAAVMELGALVCTARSPACGQCPVAYLCAWQLAGRPEHEGPPRRGQAWQGTDRQVRGRIVQLLRESTDPVTRTAMAAVWPDDESKVERCLAGLLEDGLAEQDADGRYSLPS